MNAQNQKQDGLVTRDSQGTLTNTTLHHEAAELPYTPAEREEAIVNLMRFGLTRQEAEALS